MSQELETKLGRQQEPHLTIREAKCAVKRDLLPQEGGGSHREALRAGLRGPPRFTDPDAAVLSSGHHFRKLGTEKPGFQQSFKAHVRSIPSARPGLRQASRPCAEQPLPQRRSPESEPGAGTTPARSHHLRVAGHTAPQQMTVGLPGKRVHWEPATWTLRPSTPPHPTDHAAVSLRPNQPEHLTPAIQGRLSARRPENAEHKDGGPRGSAAAGPFSLQASE